MDRITKKYSDNTPFISNKKNLNAWYWEYSKKISKYEDAEEAELRLNVCK